MRPAGWVCRSRYSLRKGNGVEKNAAMTGWGAELIEFGEDFEEARLESARRCGRPKDAMIVPPFQHALVRGVATYALELFSAVAELDAVYVPIGMGFGRVRSHPHARSAQA